MAAGAFFKTEAALRDAGLWLVPGRSRRDLSDHVHGRTHADASADADDECVVVVDDLRGQLIRIVDPYRLDVQSNVLADCPRDNRAESRRIAVSEVVRPVD